VLVNELAAWKQTALLRALKFTFIEHDRAAAAAAAAAAGR